MSVTANTAANFEVDVTLPSLNEDPQPTSPAELADELAADPSNCVFTDEADEDGRPLGTHSNFADLEVLNKKLHFAQFADGDVSAARSRSSRLGPRRSKPLLFLKMTTDCP